LRKLVDEETGELPKSEVLSEMIEKLKNDPDKYERMFAGQYLAKYNYIESKEFLKKAIVNESDPEVVACLIQHINSAEELLKQKN